MKEKQNYYEILAINREDVDFTYKTNEEGLIDVKKREKRSPQSKHDYIKKAYDERLAVIKYIREQAKNDRNIEEIDKAIEKLNTAYEVLGKESSRELYNMELDKKNNKRNRILIEGTAYDFFDVLEENLKKFSSKQVDKQLQSIKDSKLEKYEKILKNPDITFAERQKIELLISKTNKYYSYIETTEKREKYNSFLDRKEQEEIAKRHQMEIKNKYCHISESNPDLIDTFKGEKTKGEKAVAKKKTKETPIIYLHDERNMQLKKISEIAFRNCTGVNNSYINEYEITRVINGEEKKDIIYTNLSLPELAINNKTNRPVNKKYYDCVVNKLLSEDTIAGAKYNNGYIGMIEETHQSEYDITLGADKLNATEQEMLTAVQIIKEREETSKVKKGENR